MSKKSSVSSSSTIPSLVTHAAIQRAQEQLSAIEKELAVGDFLPDPMRGQAQAMRRDPLVRQSGTSAHMI